MANTFKSYTKASIGTSLTDVYTVPAGTTSVVIGCNLSNRTGDQINVSMLINKADVSSDDVYLVRNIPIPNGSAFEFNAGNKIILVAGDKIQITSDVASSVDVIMSVLEQT
jgi:hypothetical protein